MFCFDMCMQFVCLMTWNMLEVRKSEELLSSALHRNVLSLYLNGVWALGQLIFSCLQPWMDLGDILFAQASYA